MPSEAPPVLPDLCWPIFQGIPGKIPPAFELCRLQGLTALTLLELMCFPKYSIAKALQFTCWKVFPLVMCIQVCVHSSVCTLYNSVCTYNCVYRVQCAYYTILCAHTTVCAEFIVASIQLCVYIQKLDVCTVQCAVHINTSEVHTGICPVKPLHVAGSVASCLVFLATHVTHKLLQTLTQYTYRLYEYRIPDCSFFSPLQFLPFTLICWNEPGPVISTRSKL